MSEPLISLLYDSRYHYAGNFVSSITIASSVSLIFAGYNSTLLAIGHSKYYLLLMIFTTFTRTLGVVFGFHLIGTIGMIVGIGLANTIMLIIYWPLMIRLGISGIKIDILSITFLSIIAYILALSI